MDDPAVMSVHGRQGLGIAPATDFLGGIQSQHPQVFIVHIEAVAAAVTASAIAAFTLSATITTIASAAFPAVVAAVVSFSAFGAFCALVCGALRTGAVTIDIHIDFRVVHIVLLHHAVQEELEIFQALPFSADDSAGIGAGDDQVDLVVSGFGADFCFQTEKIQHHCQFRAGIVQHFLRHRDDHAFRLFRLFFCGCFFRAAAGIIAAAGAGIFRFFCRLNGFCGRLEGADSILAAATGGLFRFFLNRVFFGNCVHNRIQFVFVFHSLTLQKSLCYFAFAVLVLPDGDPLSFSAIF